MKSYYFIGLACSMLTLAAQASEQNDTTLFVRNPDCVTVEEGNGQMKVTVEGMPGNATFRVERCRELKDNGITVVRERTNWGIDLPFISGKNKRHYKDIDCHLPEFFIGFSSMVNADNGLHSTFGSSVEIGFTALQISGPMLAENLSIASGLGFTWRNYRMTGYTRFVKKGSNLLLDNYPENADIQFSRIKTFSLTVPLLLEWHHRLSKKSLLWIQAGPLFNFTTYASMKTRYKLDGQKHKEFDKNIHQEPITVDLYGTVGINNVGLYCRYAPYRILKRAYNPAFSSLSFGIALSF